MYQPIALERATPAPVLPFPQPAAGTLPAAPGHGACGSCRLREDCLAVVAGDLARPGSAQLLIGRRRLRKGESLFREGSPFGSLYAVRFGTLKAAFTLDDGREQVTGFFFAGDVVGFEGIASGRHATFAVALEDSEVCTIPYEELLRLQPSGGGEVPAARMARIAAGELVREHAAKAITSLRQADPRVAAFLVMLSRRMRACGLSGTQFELRMSRAEIGSYLGLTLESVSRAFSAFAAQGWIEVRKRSVRVVSLLPLQRLCEPAGSVLQDQFSACAPADDRRAA